MRRNIFYGEVNVPDGVYQGQQGGYEVKMNVDGKEVLFRTDSGLRGMNIRVTVTVTNGKPIIKLVKDPNNESK